MRSALLSMVLLVTLGGVACDDAKKVAPKSCIGAGCVVVTTGRYNPDFTGVGTLNTLELPAKTLTTGIDATLDPDVFVAVRQAREEALVIGRSSGTVRLYDARSWTVLAEVSAGDVDHPAATSFPSGFYWQPDSTEVVVAFGGNDAAHAVGVVDVAQPAAGVIRWIALAPDAADPDGMPEAGSMYVCKNKLYVLQQSYSFDPMTYQVSYHPAKIAELDAQNPTAVLRTISLLGKNPSSITAAGAGCDNVLVSSSGNLFSEPDGASGIEAVDLTKSASTGYLLTDQQIGGRATSVIGVSSALAFMAQWTDLQPNDMGQVFLSSAKVVAFNPTTKGLIGDITKKAGNVAFVAVSPDNQLFVGTGLYNKMEEPGKLKQGLYFGAANGEGLADTPLDFVDAPNGIAFER